MKILSGFYFLAFVCIGFVSSLAIDSATSKSAAFFAGICIGAVGLSLVIGIAKDIFKIKITIN